jgi:hypothetical protein
MKLSGTRKSSRIAWTEEDINLETHYIRVRELTNARNVQVGGQEGMTFRAVRFPVLLRIIDSFVDYTRFQY